MQDVITLSVNLAPGGQHAATVVLLRKFAALLDGSDNVEYTAGGAPIAVGRTTTVASTTLDDGAEAPAAEPKRGRGRPPGATNKKKAAADDEDETSVIDAASLRKGAAAEDDGPAPDDDEPADDGLGFDDDAGDEAPEALTLENDIIPAFQKYAKAHGREKAAKVLAKFKVNSVRDLPQTSYEKVLAALKSAK